MTVSQIKCFLKAAELLNFTKAAKALYIAQSHLSKQISALEQELGVKLFVRSHRSVQLTPEGNVFAAKIKTVPEIIDEAIEETVAAGQEKGRSLSIGILEGQEVNAVMISKLFKFQRMYPAINLDMERCGFKKLRTGLKTGHFDVAVTLDFDMADEQDFNTEMIVKQEVAIAIHRSNPLSQHKNLTLGMLAEETFIVISSEESPAGYAGFMAECKKYNFVPKTLQLVSSVENQMLHVETGVGIALLDRNTRLEKNPEVMFFNLPDSKGADVIIAWRKTDNNTILTLFIKALSE
jgi:DNA-binding transcriptional LysR family regulator